jgi:hypothetical protein
MRQTDGNNSLAESSKVSALPVYGGSRFKGSIVQRKSRWFKAFKPFNLCAQFKSLTDKEQTEFLRFENSRRSGNLGFEQYRWLKEGDRSNKSEPTALR